MFRNSARSGARESAPCSASSAFPIRWRPACRWRPPELSGRCCRSSRLDAEDWPFRRVVSVVTNNLLASIERPARTSAEWLVRDLQIAKGRDSLLTRVQTLAGELASASGEMAHRAVLSHRDHQIQAAAAALPFLRQLAAALDELPRQATPTEWIAAFAHLGDRLGIHCLAITRNDSDDSENTAAWRSSPITSHRSNAGQLGWASPRRSCRATPCCGCWSTSRRTSRCRASSTTSAACAFSRPRPRGPSRPSTCSWPACRSRRSPRRSVPAGSTPRPTTASSPTSRTNRGPPPSRAPVQRSQEEMLLFYEVLTRAGERLTISYPALDDKAQALPPSPYVTEVERSIAPAAVDTPSRAVAVATAQRHVAVATLAGRLAIAGRTPSARITTVASRCLAGLFADPAMNGRCQLARGRRCGSSPPAAAATPSARPRDCWKATPSARGSPADSAASTCGAPANGRRTRSARIAFSGGRARAANRSASWCSRPTTAAAARWSTACSPSFIAACPNCFGRHNRLSQHDAAQVRRRVRKRARGAGAGDAARRRRRGAGGARPPANRQVGPALSRRSTANTTPPGPRSTQPLAPAYLEWRFGPPRSDEIAPTKTTTKTRARRRSRSCSTSATSRFASPAASTASTSARPAAGPCSTSSTTNRATGRR